MRVLAAAASAAISLLAGLAGQHACAEPPLRAGVMQDAVPFVAKGANGALTGFTVELFRLIAARMQRDIVFEEMGESALFAGLASGRFDLLPGPIPATPEKAADMLLTEGYMWTEYQFGTRSGETLHNLAELRGRRLAVRSLSTYGEWAQRNAPRYGFTVVAASGGLAAARLVAENQADASLTGSPVQDYAAAHQANYAASLSLRETRTHESAAVRRNDGELREEIEDALRCLKLNGTVARLSRTWFGHEPDAEDLENLAVPGYGVPGLAGYTAKSNKTRC